MLWQIFHCCMFLLCAVSCYSWEYVCIVMPGLGAVWLDAICRVGFVSSLLESECHCTALCASTRCLGHLLLCFV